MPLRKVGHVFFDPLVSTDYTYRMQIWRQIKPEFTDARGDIFKILDDGKTDIKSILLISSKAGAVRANHYHKKDTHHCYLVSGRMEYYERPVGSTEIPEPTIVEAGDMVFTPSMMEHAMKFTEDSQFWTFSTEARSKENYEAEIVRVKFI